MAHPRLSRARQAKSSRPAVRTVRAGQHTGRTAPAEEAGGEEKQRDRKPGQAVHRHPDLSRKEDMDKDDAVNGDTFPQVQLVVVSAPAAPCASPPLACNITLYHSRPGKKSRVCPDLPPSLVELLSTTSTLTDEALSSILFIHLSSMYCTPTVGERPGAKFFFTGEAGCGMVPGTSSHISSKHGRETHRVRSGGPASRSLKKKMEVFLCANLPPET